MKYLTSIYLKGGQVVEIDHLSVVTVETARGEIVAFDIPQVTDAVRLATFSISQIAAIVTRAV